MKLSCIDNTRGVIQKECGTTGYGGGDESLNFCQHVVCYVKMRMVTTNRRIDAFGDHLITVIVLRRFSLWMFILSLNGFLAYFCSPSSKMISTNFDDDGPNISYHTITDDQICLSRFDHNAIQDSMQRSRRQRG